MFLCEMPQIGRLKERGGPITIFARKNGKYIRPILAYNIDMRIEDNPHAPKSVMRNDAIWYAKHPTEHLYIIHNGNDKVHPIVSRATVNELKMWLKVNSDAISLPTKGDGAWWEWVVALDDHYKMVKAAKKPREFEPTPEEVDERGGEQPSLENKLTRVFI